MNVAVDIGLGMELQASLGPFEFLAPYHLQSSISSRYCLMYKQLFGHLQSPTLLQLIHPKPLQVPRTTKWFDFHY